MINTIKDDAFNTIKDDAFNTSVSKDEAFSISPVKDEAFVGVEKNESFIKDEA
jgi:hypothetical protein